MENYLKGVREARENEPVSIFNIENVPTVDEAVAIWKQIPPERMNGIPAIGINIHTPGTEAFEDVEADILSGNRSDLDIKTVRRQWK